MSEQSIDGAVLAGGRSRRMGGEAKALLTLDGRAMLDHVLERFRPQVGRVVLSVERPSPDWAPFGLEQVGDPEPGDRGPLAGLFAALDAVADPAGWLALVPCDAPFLPLDLVPRLAARAGAADAVVVRLDGVPQPTFSLWSGRLLERLRHAVLEARIGGFRQFLDGIDWTPLDWPSAERTAFFNVNDPDTLAAARRRLAGRKEAKPC
ncbi:MAG: NTP transferase domain-containing protein [Xanthomonadales bacterium]